MGSCRICIDELKNPVSLPCGHIFCGDCITKALQAVQPTSNIHSCPICRSSYNIATPSLDVFPPYLRSFVAPSIRKVFINNSPSPSATADKGAPEQPTASTSSLSEITRLQAENHALRTNCAMWRRRAEMHGAANLGLLNFARAVRDQASHLARERDELRIYCSSLKRKLDDDESWTQETSVMEAFVRSRSEFASSNSPDPESLLFSRPFSKSGTGKLPICASRPLTLTDVEAPPRKRIKLTSTYRSPGMQPEDIPDVGSPTVPIALRQMLKPANVPL